MITIRKDGSQKVLERVAREIVESLPIHGSDDHGIALVTVAVLLKSRLLPLLEAGQAMRDYEFEPGWQATVIELDKRWDDALRKALGNNKLSIVESDGDFTVTR